MNSLVKLLWPVCIVVILGGCQSAPTKYSDHHPIQRTSDNELNSIIFVDHNLNRTDITKTLLGKKAITTLKINTDRSGIRTTSTGTIEVWAVLRNRTDHDLQVEGKTMFFDESQAPLNDESTWRRVYIPANGTAVYRESSLNDRAEYFVVELREGR